MKKTTNLDNLKAIDEAWNNRNWNVYADLLADDLVAFMSGETGPQSKKEHIANAIGFCKIFPDNVVHVESYLELFENESGNKTCSVARISGTMKEDFQSGSKMIPATYKRMDVSFAVICKWRNGQIIEQRQFFDTQTMFSQILANQ